MANPAYDEITLQSDEPAQLVSMAEMKQIYACHQSTITRNVNLGHIPQPVMVGRTPRWILKEVRESIARLPRGWRHRQNLDNIQGVDVRR